MNVRWEDFGWERLAAGVGRRRLPGWDATVGLVAGDQGVLLYDTGSSLREGAELLGQVRAILHGRSVTHIALGHPHFDHLLGAGAFPDAAVYGAVGLASLPPGPMYEEAVREGVSPRDAAGSLARLPVPRHEVSGAVTIELGGREVVLANVGPGHTGHDLALLVPGSPVVVFCGDLVEESGDPQAGRDAVPAQWPAALDRLLALGGEDARYVPGHGAVVGASFVRTQRDALARRFGGS